MIIEQKKSKIILQCDNCNMIYERQFQKCFLIRKSHCCSRSCKVKLQFSTKEGKEKTSLAVKASMKKSEIRARFENAIKIRSCNPVWRQRLSAAMLIRNQDQNYRDLNSLSNKKRHQDPEYKERFLKTQRTEKIRKFRSEVQIKRWQNPENRLKQSMIMSLHWKEGDTKLGSPIWKYKQHISQKKIWNVDYRISRSGCNNPMSGKINPWWRPWMTNESKTNNWKKQILEQSHNECVICGSKSSLEAHHIIPRSVHPELALDLKNGIALCHSCHTGSDNNLNVHRLLRINKSDYQHLMTELCMKLNYIEMTVI